MPTDLHNALNRASSCLSEKLVHATTRRDGGLAKKATQAEIDAVWLEYFRDVFNAIYEYYAEIKNIEESYILNVQKKILKDYEEFLEALIEKHNIIKEKLCELRQNFLEHNMNIEEGHSSGWSPRSPSYSP